MNHEQIPRKMNILAVDDAPDNLLLLQTILEAEEFGKIYLAESAYEAYEYIGIVESEANVPLDLILMDLMMPEVTGIDAIKEIKKYPEYQDIPIVVVTAKSETEDLVEAFEAGAVDYLTKPINELELLARIRSMLKLKFETDHRKFHEFELENMATELSEKNARLERMLSELQADLEAASVMQRSLLPSENLHLPGVDFWWYFEPCQSVGGDLIDITRMADGLLSFFIIDVSGHGIQSAMMAVSLHRMLSAWGGRNSIIRSTDGSPRPPNEVVADLNEDLVLQASSLQYFTMIYGLFDTATGELCYTRAGHTPLIILRADGRLEVKHEGDVPVGLTDIDSFELIKCKINQGDRVILFSDGITEARRGQPNSREFFGEDRFYKLLYETRTQNPKQSINYIIKKFNSWLAPDTANDDLTLLIFEPHPTREKSET